jgi:hypothetical protein
MVINKAANLCRKNYQEFLFTQKILVETYFPWLTVRIDDKILKASGRLRISGTFYDVDLSYSPFLPGRFDRIYLKNSGILFNERIHLYRDLSLCLYHPLIDMPHHKTIPLTHIIPWISEWCIHYLEWKKYGVWLGKEISH